MRTVSQIVALVIVMTVMLYTSCNQNSKGKEEEEPTTDVQDTLGARWYKGVVDLPAENGLGLIALSDNSNTRWVPYTTPGFKKDSTVYMKIRSERSGQEQFAFAYDIQTERPENFNRDNKDLSFLRAKSFFPHDLYDHHHDILKSNVQHKPGHIVMIAAAKQKPIRITWTINGQDTTKTADYSLVSFKEDSSTGASETIYVPTSWTDLLKKTTDSHFMMFYTQKIRDENSVERRVVQSFSIEHNHFGHDVPVTISSGN